MEDKLFDLVGQIVVLTQTTPHSSEEERTLATLQEREEWLMRKAEKLWKKIAEVWQGISTSESDSRGSKQEAAEDVQQCQTLGREKPSSLLSSPPPAAALTTITTGVDLASSSPVWRGMSPCPLSLGIWQKKGVQSQPQTYQSQPWKQSRRMLRLMLKNLP